MALIERIQQDLKVAMRAGDVPTRETLRMVLADLKNRRIELGRDLSQDDELGVLTRGVKSRVESAEQFDAGGRPELAEKERGEIAVIERYLPEQLSEEDVRGLVQAVVAELGLTEKKQLGQVMKTMMARHKGQVDGKLVQKLAGELLA